MPETQNVWGENWNREFGNYLEKILRWERLGALNVDVAPPGNGRPRGLDSVFSYKYNESSPQQVVLIEAKTIEILENTSRSRIQNWVEELFVKLESLPRSKDFREKFQPESDARYQYALLGLWVRNLKSDDDEKLQSWLSQIHIPERKLPHYIGLISNRKITDLLAIYEEIERIRTGRFCSEIDLFVPDYGGFPFADGSASPLESLFSKFHFYHAKMLQPVKNQTVESQPYDAAFIFYTGSIKSYADVHFIGLALKYFQQFQTDEITIYTPYKPEILREYLSTFLKEFGSGKSINFAHLISRSDIPSWMTTND